MDKPYYPFKPIGSLDALATTLGVHPKLLTDFSNKANDSYVKFEIVSKSNKRRTVYEPKFELKRLQKRINSRIFEKVEYPVYLHGGISDEINKRDYVENAKLHAKSNTLICLDIKDFYGSILLDHVFDVFKNFFHFPPDVSSLLTKLVTLNGNVPQGACTSSYLANLVFFNSEYNLVSRFRGRGVTYSRLLDDVTLSSNDKLSDTLVQKYIEEVSKLFAKYSLHIKNKKTRVHIKSDHSKPYDVTGLWVGHSSPRLRKSDRRNIRHEVFLCEKEFEFDSTSEKYHKQWNRVSGLVAKMQRLQHSQAKILRQRLSKVLPTYSDADAAAVIRDANKILNAKKKENMKIGELNRINRVLYSLGILGRTNSGKAKSLGKNIRAKYNNLPGKRAFWV
ncbi:reverse transcriptase [Pokkaliibacter plantistimulans]|uniref:Reverse transcriptase n=1 Tax=Pokkaliibacter plantistimulans TaxID=1635171 RepID=A0ABX5LT55_9GAMM|nr:reverse transcriptase family protein [Pokkaliibacter plantistimulans]PXF28683.1 reverse transcriptase [Pokkaliibacter plantistimulans]